MKDGKCSEQDFAKLAAAAGDLANATVYIDDESGISLIQLKAKARKMQQDLGIQLFVIDYLQMMSAGIKTGNRQEEVSVLSRGIKQLAKELKVPIIVLSQLNRDVEKGGNRKPRLSDLRESGAIEQDADIVGMLYCPKESPGDDEYGDTQPYAKQVNLLIAKQRNGPTGEIHLTFILPFTRFEDCAK